MRTKRAPVEEELSDPMETEDEPPAPQLKLEEEPAAAVDGEETEDEEDACAVLAEELAPVQADEVKEEPASPSVVVPGPDGGEA